jgi:diguanylate cyclase (GGDEF)-like protein
MNEKVHCLDPAGLELFLERRRRAESPFPSETSLAENLIEVLHKGNEFVPSEAGSILLDDPTIKSDDRRQNTLTFIAAFGDKADSLIGRKIRATEGIAGHVYLTGGSHFTDDARSDQFFYSGIDEETQYETRSLVAIPIRIGDEVCGVLELINRQHRYSENDRKLLEIFAGYISVSIQNVLDARKAQAIAKSDNLTGLYNDRYLHIALANTVEECLERDSDLAVLFLDLDYFKRVNDTHGHLAGSQVLREVGRLLNARARRVKAIAARYGGDEFVVVLAGSELQDGVDLAEEMRGAIVGRTFISQPGDIQPEPLHLRGLTCSVGVASLRRHLPEIGDPDQVKTSLLHLADAAMYVAKETGRNRTAVAGEPIRRRSLEESSSRSEEIDEAETLSSAFDRDRN